MAAVRKEISKDDYKFFIGRVEKIGNGQVEFITDTQKKAVELLGEKIPQNVIDAEDNYKAFNIWLGSEINPIIVGEGGYKEEIHVIGDGYDFFEVKAETGNTEFKYYLKALRPLFGAVPSGYIQAEKFENAVRIPRQGYVFGTVIYNKPLTDEQVRIYDLKPDKNNPQPEDNTAAAVSNAEIIACLDDYFVNSDNAAEVEIENAAVNFGTKFEVGKIYSFGRYIMHTPYKFAKIIKREGKDKVLIECIDGHNEYCRVHTKKDNSEQWLQAKAAKFANVAVLYSDYEITAEEVNHAMELVTKQSFYYELTAERAAEFFADYMTTEKKSLKDKIQTAEVEKLIAEVDAVNAEIAAKLEAEEINAIDDYVVSSIAQDVAIGAEIDNAFIAGLKKFEVGKFYADENGRVFKVVKRNYSVVRGHIKSNITVIDKNSSEINRSTYFANDIERFYPYADGVALLADNEIKMADISTVAEKNPLKAKVAKILNRPRKSVIDWKATFDDMKISEILNLQKEFKKYLKLGQIDLAENVFSMLKTLCKNYREQFAA